MRTNDRLHQHWLAAIAANRNASPRYTAHEEARALDRLLSDLVTESESAPTGSNLRLIEAKPAQTSSSAA